MLQLNEIKKIAYSARKKFETDKIPINKLKKLYLAYNKMPNIKKFLLQAKKLFPKLNCGLATVYLKYMLGSGKIVNGKYKNNNHTFLLLANKQNKLIIDITADQYEGPKVYVGRIKKPWSLL
ncbi:TPA: hypothetical protein HA246_04075 [Candidatus Woesearchaeota archaeon]|nr:hypothetical protein [Candidatus Woesearchaeota archaeon]